MPYLDYDTDNYSQLAEQIVYSEGAQLDPNADDIEGEALLPRYVLSLEREGSLVTLRWKTSATKVPEGLSFELQVGVREDGPWYAPNIATEHNSYKWRADEENTYRVISAHFYNHRELPADLTLYYRVRPVAKDGSKGEYSNIVVTTAGDDTVNAPDIRSPDPNAPELTASGANGNVYLKWSSQDYLLDYSHAEIQVADSPNGPWYAPDTVGGDTTWRSFNSGEHTEAAGYEFVHPSVPNILLYYRIRIVTSRDHHITGLPIKSDYSNIVSVRSEVEVEAPTLTAVGSIGDVILNWNKQENLLHEKYIEIQVAENENGPWYAPYTIGDGEEWRTGEIDGVYRVSGTTTFTHTNIPIAGTPDDPQLRELYYRVRRVDSGDNESVWSNIVLASAGKVNLKFIDGVIEEAQVDATVFDALRTLSDRSLGYWSLDDTVNGQTPKEIGRLKDTSRAENHLLVESDTVATAHGIVSRGLSFSGVSASIARTTDGIGESDTWIDFTQAYFIKLLRAQTNDPVVAVSYSVDDPRLEFYVEFSRATNLQKIVLRSGDTEYSVQAKTATNLFDEEFHYIVVGYDGNAKQVNLWIDGVKKIDEAITDDSGTTSVVEGIAQGGEIHVGGASIDGNIEKNINGIVDEVRLYSVIFTVAQVRYFLFIPEGPVPEIVDTSRLAELSITETKIAPDAVDTPHLKANSVTSNQIDALAILTKHLSANAVTSNTIAAGAVLASHILAKQVLAKHIEANAIESDHIDTAAIVARHLSAGLIDVDKLTAEAIEVLTTLPDGSVTRVKIKDGEITADKIAAGAIDSSDLISGRIITADHMDADSIVLDSATVTGILSAANIQSDVVNAVTLRTARITLGGSAGGSYVTLATPVNDFDAFICGFSMGGLVSTVTVVKGTRHYILAWDSARATEIVAGTTTSATSILRARNEIEHEEFFSPDIGEVFCEYVIGLKWPNAETIGGGLTPGTRPGKPGSLTSTEEPSGDGFRVTLDWSTVTGDGISYQVRTTVGDGTPTVGTAADSFTRIDVPANTKYSFQVRAVLNGVVGEWSDEYSGTTGAALPPLPTPASLGIRLSQRTNGSTTIYATVACVTGANNYIIEAQQRVRSSGSISSGWNDANASDTTVCGREVQVGTTGSSAVHDVQLRVKAKSSDGRESAWRESAWAQISDAPVLPVPNAVTGLSSRETAGTSDWSVRLSWLARPTAERVSSYRVDYSIGASTFSTTTTGTAVTITVPESTSYSFTVTAINASGSGSASSSYSDSVGTVPRATKLSTPGSLSSSESAGTSSWSVTLRWGAVTNRSSYTLEYTIGASTFTVTTTGTSRTITVSPNTAYSFRVRANGDGVRYTDSDFSTTYSDSVGSILQPPSQPSRASMRIIPRSQHTNSSILVNYACVTGATSYRIQVRYRFRSSGRITNDYTNAFFTRTTCGIEFELSTTGISDDHDGQMRVAAVNSAGQSTWRETRWVPVRN